MALEQKLYGGNGTLDHGLPEGIDWLEVVHQLHQKLLQDMDAAALERPAAPARGAGSASRCINSLLGFESGSGPAGRG